MACALVPDQSRRCHRPWTYDRAGLSTASSIVLTTVASHFLFAGPMSSPIIIGALIVIISGYNYQNVQ